MTLELEPIGLTDGVTTTPLDISDVTTESLDGTGAFDILMRTMKLHLREEFTSNRIVGKEYAEVYLGALDKVLAQSINFLSIKDNTSKTAAEVGLLRQQIVTELAKTDDLIPDGLGFNDGTDIAGLTANELLLSAKRIEEADAGITLTVQKQVTELAQTSDNKPLDLGLTSSIDITGIAGTTKEKYESDIRLSNQKVVTEVSNVADLLPVDLGTSTNSDVQGTVKINQDLLSEQVNKTTSETGLLDQKSVTELAQTDDNIPSTLGYNTSTTVLGVVAKNKSLIVKQTDGFDRDAEQKLSKMLLDTWIVRQTTDGADSGLAGIAEADIKSVVDKTKVGIGVSPL